MLVAVCALIHTTSMVFTGEWLLKRLHSIERHPSVRVHSILLSSVFTIILVLHLGEMILWAVVYDELGLLNDLRTSLDFSVGSYTTNSAPGIQLPGMWRLLGQLESIAGPLLVGLSTAFLFIVIRKLFESRQIAHEKGKLA
jgi:hypothetical protein